MPRYVLLVFLTMHIWCIFIEHEYLSQRNLVVIIFDGSNSVRCHDVVCSAGDRRYHVQAHSHAIIHGSVIYLLFDGDQQFYGRQTDLVGLRVRLLCDVCTSYL